MKSFNSILMLLLAFAFSCSSQKTTLPKCDPDHKDMINAVSGEDIRFDLTTADAVSYAGPAYLTEDHPLHRSDFLEAYQTTPANTVNIFNDYQPFSIPEKITYQTAEYKYSNPEAVEKPPLKNSRDLTISNITAKPYFVKNEIVKPGSKVPVVNTQNPGEVIDSIKKAKSWQDLVNIETGLMSLLMLLGGYLSWLIPGIKKIPNTTYRVLAVAVLIVAGCFTIGFGEIWQGALAYLFSTSLYEVIFKLFKRTPTPPVAPPFAPDTPAYS